MVKFHIRNNRGSQRRMFISLNDVCEEQGIIKLTLTFYITLVCRSAVHVTVYKVYQSKEHITIFDTYTSYANRNWICTV